VVCVVDDDPSVRGALRRLFRGAGLTVLTFESAEEFLQRVDGITGACVVADVHLGRMSGLELHATLNRRVDPIPVILISGVADANMELEAGRLGAIAFFSKPFDAAALLASVTTGLQRAVSLSGSRP
jgi:FixJ family two-component response regulator